MGPAQCGSNDTWHARGSQGKASFGSGQDLLTDGYEVPHHHGPIPFWGYPSSEVMDPVVFSGGLEDNHRFVFSDFLFDRGMTWQAEAVQKATWAETFGLDEYGVYASCIHIGKMRLVPFKNSPFWLATERKPELPWNSLWKILPQISSKFTLEDFLPTLEEWRHACIESDLGILKYAGVWEMTKCAKSTVTNKPTMFRFLVNSIPPFETHVVSVIVMGYIRVKIPII